MNAKYGMAVLMAAVAVSVFVFAAPAQAQQPAVPPGVQEVTQTEETYCGICEAKRNVNSLCPYMNWGFDQRARVEYFKNAIDPRLPVFAYPNPADPTVRERIGTLNDKAANNEYLFTRYRTRLWTQVRPVEELDLALNARAVWEFFNFCKPESRDNTPRSEVIFDDLNVRWGNIGDMPLSVTVGRQQMRFGDGWLVFEGTPLDGSRTVFFDAIRGTYNAEEMNTIFDVVYVHNKADAGDGLVPPFNHDNVEDAGVSPAGHITEDDESGIILYAQNKSLENTQVDGYFIYYHAEADRGNAIVDPDAEQDDGETVADIYTVGSRVASDISENLQGRVEGAFQFGNNQDESLCGAWGLNSRLTYRFRDDWDTSAWTGYEYRSGNKDPDQNFQMPWARYPQWSDVYSGALDWTEGRRAGGSNLHRLYVGGGFTPIKQLTFQGNYHLLFADNNNVPTSVDVDHDDDPATAGIPTSTGFSRRGCFRGQLVTALLKYEFSEHISGHLVGEAFFPGDYYTNDRNDPAYFARYELVFTW